MYMHVSLFYKEDTNKKLKVPGQGVNYHLWENMQKRINVQLNDYISITSYVSCKHMPTTQNIYVMSQSAGIISSSYERKKAKSFVNQLNKNIFHDETLFHKLRLLKDTCYIYTMLAFIHSHIAFGWDVFRN